MFGFNKKNRTILMDVNDVTTVLGFVNHHRQYDSVRVGNCGWGQEYNTWFVMFDADDKVYGEIMKGLMKIGKFNLSVRPGGKVDMLFERGT